MKFFKWFFLGLGFWIILIMLITYPINTRAGAVSSVTLSDKAVTFYSPNGREEIYSLNVPFGTTLNDIQNSNQIPAQLSSFSEWSPVDNTGSNVGFNMFTGATFNPTTKLLTISQIYGGIRWLNRDTSTYINGVYTFSLKISDVSENFRVYAQIIGHYNGGAVTLSNLVINSAGSFSIFVDIDFSQYNFYNFDFRLVCYDVNTSNIYPCVCTLDYFDVQFNTNYEYFNSYYLNQLYHNAGYDISNLSWSESPYTSIPFSYNDPIEFNTNLYPSKVTESFSLTDSWQSLLTGLDKNYMTFNTFQDLVETFQDLTDPNNLKVDNFIDVFKALWFLLKSVFVLLYNVLMLIIAPFVDLFVMLISALFSGLDFWILV